MSELRSDRTDDGVVTLWLASPERPVVVLDKWLIAQLHSFFDALDQQPSPSGFVLMSDNDRVFVAGADLAEIDALNDADLHAYLEDAAAAFARIAALPCPSVAGINGAALGGGLEIAMHCDALIAYVPPDDQKPYRIGLPEAGLGLCPGWGGTQMLPARLDPQQAIQLTATGFTPKVTELTELFAASVSDPTHLHERAVEWVRGQQQSDDHDARTTPTCIDSSNSAAIGHALEKVTSELPDTPAAHAVVDAVRTGIAHGWERAIARERELLVGLRHTDIARQKLEAFFAKAG